MKIYLAGTSVSNPKKERPLQKLFKQGHKLHSYFHCVNGFEKNWFQMNIKRKVDLFIDSGAFSAWTQKIEIDIQEYIEFIKTNIDIISVYANLDVIGDPRKTYQNQLIMESAGLHPIPVFHYGENFKWLSRYIDLGHKYIAFGGLVGAKNVIPFLNKCFSSYICDEKGIPKVKVHGFGLTSFDLMFRYPWYSVDSTSWVVTGRLGSVFIPVFRNGKFDYSKPPHKIAVSSISPSLKEAGQHITNLSVNQKNIFLNYLKTIGYKLGISEFKKEQQTYELKENERWSGKKPKNKNEMRLVEVIVEEGISNSYKLRDEVNVLYYLELEKHFPTYPCQFKVGTNQKGLF